MDPLHGMTCPFLSDRNPLWTPSNLTARRFFSPKQYSCHVFCTSLLSYTCHVFCTSLLSYTAVFSAPHCYLTPATFSAPHCYLTPDMFSAPHCYLTPAMFPAPHCNLPSPQVSVIQIGCKLKVNFLTEYRKNKKEEEQNEITNFPEE